MSQQYLLPCQCGKSLSVTVAQAGRMLPCECGQQLKVPSLAGLRQLEQVESRAPKPGGEWNQARGGMFVAGVLLAIIGLAVGGYASYIMRQVDIRHISKDFQDREVKHLEMIEEMPADRIYDEWKLILASGPGAAGSARPQLAQSFLNYWTTVAIVSFSAAGVGILAAGGSLIGVRK